MNLPIQKPDSPPRLFCAAPWLEAVVRMDGAVRPCCRSDVLLGSLEHNDLAKVWRGVPSQSFRRKIAEGQFPSPVCEGCFSAGKQTTLRKVFDQRIARLWEDYVASTADADPDLCEAIAPFHDAVRQNRIDDIGVLASEVERIITNLVHESEEEDQEALSKIAYIARSCADYCDGALTPAITAPMRQVSLIAICNARCIHCVGTYSGEIRKGQLVDGKRQKRIGDDMVIKAMAMPQHTMGFFLSGSEFFLYPQWQELLKQMERQAIRISIATNGMLMSEETSQIVAESSAVNDLNFSFDGAVANTVETIRERVKFNQLCEAVTTFLNALEAAGRKDLPVVLSMVLMKRNFEEAPALVELAHKLRAGRPVPLHVNFQVLDATPQPEYLKFRAAEYVDFKDPDTRNALERAAETSERLQLDTYYTYKGALADVLAQ